MIFILLFPTQMEIKTVLEKFISACRWKALLDELSVLKVYVFITLPLLTSRALLSIPDYFRYSWHFTALEP